MSAGPLDRGGHLSPWALDRLELEAPESDRPFFEAADAHLTACADCRAIVAARRATHASLVMAPPKTGSAAVAGRRRSTWVGGVVLLLAAAGAILATRTPEVLRKGATFELEVQVHDGQRSARIDDGALVHPGDRIGFGARAERSGFLLVFGWDSDGRPYPVWPAAALGDAIALVASTDVAPLPVAIALDGQGDRESFAALFCDRTIAFDELALGPRVTAASVTDAARRRGCVARVVALAKRPR